jgi:hypothetical protein
MKISKAVLAIALVMAIMMGGTYVFAQDPPKPKPEMKCEQRFIEIDADKDGKVTLQEFTAIKHPGGKAEEIFKMRDANGDGVLTKEEFCSGKPMKGQGKKSN